MEARVVAHERGPKLRIVKFKPKRGYRRRTGHRQELTRLEVTSVTLSGSGSSSSSKKAEPAPVAAAAASSTSTSEEATENGA